MDRPARCAMMKRARVEWFRPRPTREITYHQSRLPDEAPDHPYGQWTLVLQRQPWTDEYLVTYLVEEAPHHKLTGQIELLEGPKLVGVVTILDDGAEES